MQPIRPAPYGQANMPISQEIQGVKNLRDFLKTYPHLFGPTARPPTGSEKFQIAQHLLAYCNFDLTTMYGILNLIKRDYTPLSMRNTVEGELYPGSKPIDHAHKAMDVLVNCVRFQNLLWAVEEFLRINHALDAPSKTAATSSSSSSSSSSSLSGLVAHIDATAVVPLKGNSELSETRNLLQLTLQQNDTLNAKVAEQAAKVAEQANEIEKLRAQLLAPRPSEDNKVLQLQIIQLQRSHENDVRQINEQRQRLEAQQADLIRRKTEEDNLLKQINDLKTQLAQKTKECNDSAILVQQLCSQGAPGAETPLLSAAGAAVAPGAVTTAAPLSKWDMLPAHEKWCNSPAKIEDLSVRLARGISTVIAYINFDNNNDYHSLKAIIADHSTGLAQCKAVIQELQKMGITKTNFDQALRRSGQISLATTFLQ